MTSFKFLKDLMDIVLSIEWVECMLVAGGGMAEAEEPIRKQLWNPRSVRQSLWPGWWSGGPKKWTESDCIMMVDFRFTVGLNVRCEVNRHEG